METLSNILASFDIFQVLLNAFPLITDPIVSAFEQIFNTLYHYFLGLFVAHPGISLGLVFFLSGYLVMTFFRKIRQRLISLPKFAK